MMWAHSKLSWQREWAGAALINKRILVCRECLDQPQPNGRKTLIIGPDPVPVRDPRPGFQAQQQEGASWPYGQVPSLNPGAVPYILDEIAIPTPTPELWNNGGALALVTAAGFPTDPTGLAPGAVWNNGLEVAIVPGVVPPPVAIARYFPGITALQLLQIGGGSFPLVPQVAGSGQLWNNGGGIGVS